MIPGDSGLSVIRWLAAWGLALAVGGAAAQSKGEPAPATRLDGEALLSAVVQVKVKALASARSNATLGRERAGTGIVLDDRGHILTIGYIVIEPDSIEVVSADNKTAAATLVGYDHQTGFGLLRASTPLSAKPIVLGDSGRLAEAEPVMVLPHGGRDAAMVARVMSTRSFTGSWEYLLDSAIWTAPPTMAWAGAALINREGKLVGVGSLLVRDTVGAGQQSPGNLFVPTDTLKPILASLIANGKRDGPQRPWLGLATETMQDRLFVTRVSPGSPAEQAGLRQGDIVMNVGPDAVKTHAELYTKIWSLGAAGVEVPLKVLQGADVRDVRVKSIDRFEYFREKPGT
jgi:serine protease Do